MDTVGVKALLLVICSLVVSINCTTDDKAVSKPLNGRTLFDIGVKIKSPTLRLLGKTFMELECRYHFCSAWSEWSDCELLAGQFGRQSRSRQCGIDTSCGQSNSPRNETDSRLCQDLCSHDYDKTPEGFCLKFYNTTQKSWPDSKASCETNGGHLMNINSPMKWKAFVWMMEKYDYNSAAVHIDGQRKDVNSPWLFGYETDINGFTNWRSGEPGKGSTELCLYGYTASSSPGIGDSTCASSRYYVCEKLPFI